jgi:hypothetical protein
MKDRVVGYCWELIVQNGGDKVSKGMLEQRLLENKIAARYVREFGGIKALRKMAEDKFKKDEDS